MRTAVGALPLAFRSFSMLFMWLEMRREAARLWEDARTPLQLKNFAVLFRKDTRKRYLNGVRRASDAMWICAG